MWNFLIMVAISAIVTYALMPRSQSPQQKPAALGDFNFPTADESRSIPVVFGTVKLADPNVVWYGDLRTRAIRKRGGKK